MGFLSALALIMITLKLIGVITFSWWLVLIPLYPAVLIWGLVILSIFVFGVKEDKRRRRPF